MEKNYLDKEIKHFLVNVGWTHKIQICQSEIYIESSKKIKIAKIILTSFTSVGLGSFVLKLLPDYQYIAIIIIFILSLTLTIVVALDKENDYEKLSSNNKIASDKCWELREKALELLFKLKTDYDIVAIRDEFLELKKMRLQVNHELPYTSEKSVAVAKKKLKENCDNDYSNDYKYFIPEILRSVED